MFARAIHFLSPRASKPFNALNCGAVPVDLMENELFGHESGAFTGATKSSVGLLRQTDGGSLFLDEVDCLPLLAQVKLLRFLQEKEFRPLGAPKPCRCDVRVIAASNEKLDEAVRCRRFREDLYFRLNVMWLTLPPLRERSEDIPLLARHFVAKYSAAFKAPAKSLSVAAMQKLMLYEWRGNIRELENVVERSVALSLQTVLGPEDIELPIDVTVGQSESFQALKAQTISGFERGYIQNLLRAHNGNVSRAAQAVHNGRLRKQCGAGGLEVEFPPILV
jgi:two-component system, NtrC family, response regulator GlrR